MPDPALFIFAITYAGVALGRIPGLMLDRTGIALLGAIAMIVSGSVPLPEAVAAIDLPTILLLYALMVLSAQLRLGGFYTWVADRTTGLMDRPRLFLFISMLSAALLSALLANDIVCLAFTPVLCLAVLNKGLNPLPFLLGLATASNIGSAATIIGNPQNMLIGQVGRLNFGEFLAWCGPPALVALGGTWLILSILYRDNFAAASAARPGEKHETNGHMARQMRDRGLNAIQEVCEQADNKADVVSGDRFWPEFDLWQSGKGLVATIILVGLFFTSIPRELSAITVAGVLLCSRKMRSRRIMELIDWQLITLFCSLFIVVHGITARNLPERLMDTLAGWGLQITDPFALTGLTAIMSNLVSNVPAVMLLVRFLDPNVPEPWFVLALSSTFAGNLLIIGSIANLIVIEQAEKFKVRISFAEYARAGVPITLFSLFLVVLMLAGLKFSG